jgi:hypothetical protein
VQGENKRRHSDMLYVPHSSSSTNTTHFTHHFKKAEKGHEESKHPPLAHRLAREMHPGESETVLPSVPSTPQSHLSILSPLLKRARWQQTFYPLTNQAGVTNPPAISTHSGIQLPSLPSTSTISVSHLHLQPTPFSFSVSHLAQ